MNVETGEVEGGLVMMLESYKMMYCPRGKGVDDSGLVNFIMYPVPSSETNVHGVVVVVAVFIALLQLLVNTTVFNKMGLGTKRLNAPPISISLSTVYLT